AVPTRPARPALTSSSVPGSGTTGGVCRMPDTSKRTTWPSVSNVTAAATGIVQGAKVCGPPGSITERTSSSNVNESGSCSVNVNSGKPETATTPLISDSVQPARSYTPGSPSLTGPTSPIPISTTRSLAVKSAKKPLPDQLPLAK